MVIMGFYRFKGIFTSVLPVLWYYYLVDLLSVLNFGGTVGRGVSLKWFPDHFNIEI